MRSERVVIALRSACWYLWSLHTPFMLFALHYAIYAVMPSSVSLNLKMYFRTKAYPSYEDSAEGPLLNTVMHFALYSPIAPHSTGV